ncbi:hypothetical protein HDC93_006582 [Streptomyces sp. AK010]|nr:hypothetical protein [Streptomyces sp. AK010]
MGSVKHAIPVVHEDGLGEWVEAGRDQGHALLGVGLMGTGCERGILPALARASTGRG